MLLDIIVPHYDEPWTEGKKLFDMLALQRDVEFGSFRVILVNDGNLCDVYPEIVRQRYPYEVVGLEIPHGGVSAARNRGLEYSQAQWVMFCDFDDTFTNVYSLRSIMDALETDRHDLLWCPFYVEVNENQKRTIRKKFNWIFIHGKVFRRSFLRDHGITFPEHLYYSEDTAFNRVVEMEIGENRIGEITSEIVPYVWVWRNGSATTDPEKTYSNAIGLFRRQRYVADQHMIRGQKELHDAVATRALCDAYVTLNRADLTCDRSEFKEEVVGFLREKLPDMKISLQVVETAYTSALKEAFVTEEQMPKDTAFLVWLAGISREAEIPEGPKIDNEGSEIG